MFEEIIIYMKFWDGHNSNIATMYHGLERSLPVHLPLSGHHTSPFNVSRRGNILPLAVACFSHLGDRGTSSVSRCVPRRVKSPFWVKFSTDKDGKISYIILWGVRYLKIHVHVNDHRRSEITGRSSIFKIYKVSTFLCINKLTFHRGNPVLQDIKRV